MATVLYSCFGTTDPIRGMRDGGLMHILRHYRPDVVYLFLSAEITRFDRKDDRIRKMFDYLRENWDGYAPQLVRIDSGIENPSDMDLLMDPMNDLMQQIVREHPDAKVLMNLSSGTPQMQMLLALLAMDTRFRTEGIQVRNPEKASGTADRNNTKNYSVEDTLETNLDELPEEENRCCVPKMLAVRREAARNQLIGLVSRRNYGAIAQMGGVLPKPIPQLARHLDYRSRFLLKEAEDAAEGLPGKKQLGVSLQSGRGEYPYSVYEMIEYFGMLSHLVHLKRYTDYMLRLNPFLIRLQIRLLEECLQAHSIGIGQILGTGREREVLADSIAQNHPGLLTFVERELNGSLKQAPASIRVLNLMLEYYGLNTADMDLLKNCERGNQKLRNLAAHDLFTVTNDHIVTYCGMTAEDMIRQLEKLMLSTLTAYDEKEIKNRINIYERCDRIIRDCL